MAPRPPEHLIELLQRTGLATAAQVHRQARRVARLARGLPSFDWVWLDALVQARVLTPFQAAEIGAGRGERLRVGPYVCSRPLSWPQYARTYQARRLEDGKLAWLVVFESPDDAPTGSDPGNRTPARRSLFEQLQELVTCAGQTPSVHLAPIREVGRDEKRVWAAAHWPEGISVGRLLCHHGRFEPQAVWEIARQMVAGLVQLERLGLCHGDVCAAGLVVDGNGRVAMPLPGLRALVRPEEGYARADLPPEAFDYLAPERVQFGTPPSVAGDIFACGCLWWQMLTGRPPLGGGDSLGKLRAAQQAAIPDVRRLAPACPEPLAAVVDACVRRNPVDRPGSMAELAQMLGTPSRKAAVVVARQSQPRRNALAVQWHQQIDRMRQSGTAAFWAAVAVGCLLAIAGAWRAGWSRTGQTLPPTGQLSANLPSGEHSARGGSEASPSHARAAGAHPGASDASAAARLSDPADRQARQTQPVRPDRIMQGSNVAQHGALAREPEHGSSPAAKAGVRRAEFLDPVAQAGGSALRAPTRPALPTSAASDAARTGAQGPIPARFDQPGRTSAQIVVDRQAVARLGQSLRLRSGQHVRGKGPGRVPVAVPPDGLVVDAEGVVFENLAFYWTPGHAGAAGRSTARQPASPPEALLVLRCSRAEFRSCTFSLEGPSGPDRPVGLAWRWPRSAEADLAHSAPAELPSGCLRFENCAFLDVRAAVDCQSRAALAVELDNVLHVAPGPMLRLAGVPGADCPLVIRARRLTLRNFDPLLEIGGAEISPHNSLGEIRIEANACVFAPQPPAPLVFFRGTPVDCGALAESLWWTGQGSLVAEGISVAGCGSSMLEAEALDEAKLAIAGLVRSRVEFAGQQLEELAQNRVIGWQAPLRGTLAPGFAPEPTAPMATDGL